MEPEDWNIVILGAWNRAILSPAWIQENMLALPQGSPVDVLVPLDGFAPFQVHDRGLTVVPLPGQLIIQLAEPTEALLTRAKEVACRAVDDLPRTPQRACGINLRYAAPESPVELLTRMRCSTEQIFSDEGYDLRTRRRGETLKFFEGVLNIIADIPTDGKCNIVLNFDRQSVAKDDVLAWLRKDATVFMNEALKIVRLIAE